ncbi:MAG: hypothetical protein LAT62_11205 [Natronospirillum sp.]|uniref:hypothetical protein n=1 Tax=Natronospirillum sp. TaxID=2812955 RepID=UPI0025CCA5AB|nr:hypothetical protein [Natronospirillum sp.]MCH8552497.1 hypothetical protein [Natronospirillum sp.]
MNLLLSFFGLILGAYEAASFLSPILRWPAYIALSAIVLGIVIGLLYGVLALLGIGISVNVTW